MLMLAITLQVAQAQQRSEIITPLKPLASPSTWVNDDDYPPASASAGHEGTVGYRLEIDPSGIPASCQVTETSGFQDLDEQTCRLVVRRARFSPARSREGKAVTAPFKAHFTWRIEKVAPTFGVAQSDIEISASNVVLSCSARGKAVVGSLPLCEMEQVGQQVKLFSRNGTGHHRNVRVEYAFSAASDPTAMAYNLPNTSKILMYTIHFNTDDSTGSFRCDMHIERSEEIDFPVPTDFCRKPTEYGAIKRGDIAFAVSWTELP